MKKNIGSADRAGRFILGAIIIGLGIVNQSLWGLIGLVLIGTAAISFCPAYLPFGLNTCKAEKGKDVIT